MTLYPLSLCVVTKGNYLFLFGADAKYFRPMAVRFDVKTNTWLDLKTATIQGVCRDSCYFIEGQYLFARRIGSKGQ